jgi:hypothetical protein
MRIGEEESSGGDWQGRGPGLFWRWQHRFDQSIVGNKPVDR